MMNPSIQILLENTMYTLKTKLTNCSLVAVDPAACFSFILFEIISSSEGRVSLDFFNFFLSFLCDFLWTFDSGDEDLSRFFFFFFSRDLDRSLLCFPILIWLVRHVHAAPGTHRVHLYCQQTAYFRLGAMSHIHVVLGNFNR